MNEQKLKQMVNATLETLSWRALVSLRVKGFIEMLYHQGFIKFYASTIL